MDQRTEYLMNVFIENCYDLGLTDDEIKALYIDAQSTKDDSEAEFKKHLNKNYKKIVTESNKLAKKGFQAPHIQEYFNELEKKYSKEEV